MAIGRARGTVISGAPPSFRGEVGAKRRVGTGSSVSRVRAYGAPDDGNPEYAFARRGEVELHLSLSPDHDPKVSASSCYLYVSDADALHAAWTAGNVASRLGRPATPAARFFYPLLL